MREREREREGEPYHEPSRNVAAAPSQSVSREEHFTTDVAHDGHKRRRRCFPRWNRSIICKKVRGARAPLVIVVASVYTDRPRARARVLQHDDGDEMRGATGGPSREKM